MVSAPTIAAEGQKIQPQALAPASLQETAELKQGENAGNRTPLQSNTENEELEESHALHQPLPSKKILGERPGDEEAPESEQARIERLGRERPLKFSSFGAELAFCYSIIASQFMAVSLFTLIQHPYAS